MNKRPNNQITALYGVVLEKTKPLEEYDLMLERVSPACQMRANRFRRRVDGENTVLGELLLIDMLQQLSGYASIELARDPFGKPFFREDPTIQVNISHSGDFVACAVAPASVGIDVQVVHHASPALVRRFFSAGEACYVMEGDAEHWAKRFCRIWAMKESYIKRDGRGLRIPLNSFDVIQIAQEQPDLFHEIPVTPRANCQICCAAPAVGSLIHMDAHDYLQGGLRFME